MFTIHRIRNMGCVHIIKYLRCHIEGAWTFTLYNVMKLRQKICITVVIIDISEYYGHDCGGIMFLCSH